jgi:AcrR family transcriptional regulator
MLQRALTHLTLQQGYEATTVAAICDAAGVGRSTFYAHFASKDDLKRDGLEQLRDELRAAQHESSGSANRTFAFSLPMFEHARGHLAAYRALSGNHGGVVALEKIRQILSDLVREELVARAPMGTMDAGARAFTVQYLVGAFMATMTWWLDAGAKLPPQAMDAMFRRLATEGVMASPQGTT